MPWEHCGASVPDDSPCPACAMTKAQWTVQWNVTRTFKVKPRATVRLQLLAADGQTPLAGAEYVVVREGGEEVRGALDDNGQASVPSPGAVRVRFPGHGEASPLAEEGAAAAVPDGDAFRVEPGRRARFALGGPLWVWARLLHDDGERAVADAEYTLRALPDGPRWTGRTDAEGVLRHERLPDALFEVTCLGVTERVQAWDHAAHAGLADPCCIRLRGAPAGAPAAGPGGERTVRLALGDVDGAHAGTRYRLDLGPETFEGALDDAGVLEHPAPPGATTGRLTLWLEATAPPAGDAPDDPPASATTASTGGLVEWTVDLNLAAPAAAAPAAAAPAAPDQARAPRRATTCCPAHAETAPPPARLSRASSSGGVARVPTGAPGGAAHRLDTTARAGVLAALVKPDAAAARRAGGADAVADLAAGRPPGRRGPRVRQPGQPSPVRATAVDAARPGGAGAASAGAFAAAAPDGEGAGSAGALAGAVLGASG